MENVRTVILVCSCSRGPSIGLKGRVLLVLEDNPNKVGVRFDKAVYGGNNLVDLCEDGHGYFCNGMYDLIHIYVLCVQQIMCYFI